MTGVSEYGVDRHSYSLYCYYWALTTEDPLARRFYFDLETDGELIQDTEGVKAKNLEQAIKDATLVIRDIIGESGHSGLGNNSVLVVRDQGGSVVALLPITGLNSNS